MKYNLKILAFFVLSTVCLSTPVMAQDELFEDGMAAYERQDYESALVNFTYALENKYLMKGKNVPRAYNFRAKTVAEYFQRMLQNNNSTFIASHSNILITAFEDLDQAIRFDDGKCRSLIIDTKSQLLEVTFEFGQSIADSLRIDRGSNDPQSDSLINLVIDELHILQELEGESYQVNDLLGLLQYKGGKISEAVASFDISEKIYQQNPPLVPDFHHVYNYYYSTIIHYLELHDFERALSDVTKARAYISQNFENDPAAILLDSKLKTLEYQVKLLEN